jgi:hypothetical protein
MLSSIAIASVIVVVVVVIVAVHRAVAFVVVDVVSRTRNSPPPPSPLLSLPPCDSPIIAQQSSSSPPPLPWSDEDGEVVGGLRWLVVVASPEVNNDDGDPISLWASCAIARIRRMILFITARLPTLPLPLTLLFGSRFSANDPRPSPP